MKRLACLSFASMALTLAGCGNAEPRDAAPIEYSMEEDGRVMPPPARAPFEKCYAIAAAQENGGGHNGPGTAQVDRQRDAWTFVPTGQCTRLGGSLRPRPDPRLR